MDGCCVKDFIMDSRTLFLIVTVIGFGIFVNFVGTNPLVTSTEASSKVTKLLLDCIHSDYRTYIQCLKRDKRQPNEYNNEIDHACMEQCLEECKRLKRHSCERSCDHCIKKTRLKNKIINITETEYESQCTSENCTTVDRQDRPLNINVTTHVHIHNHDRYPTPEKPCGPIIPSWCYYLRWTPHWCRFPFIPSSGHHSQCSGTQTGWPLTQNCVEFPQCDPMQSPMPTLPEGIN